MNYFSLLLTIHLKILFVTKHTNHVDIIGLLYIILILLLGFFYQKAE